MWTNIDKKFPLYGADIKGSLIEESDPSSWNLNHLCLMLRCPN